MKPVLIASVVLLVSGSLAAATEKQTQPAATTSTAPDSPLVAAAKKTNRAASKRIVITNETIKSSTGHITTTKIQPSISVAEPAKGAEQVMYETKLKEKERAAERGKLAKKAADEKQKQTARLAAAAEENGGFEADPAQTEHQLEQQASSPQPAAASAQPSPSKPDDAKHR